MLRKKQETVLFGEPSLVHAEAVMSSPIPCARVAYRNHGQPYGTEIQPKT